MIKVYMVVNRYWSINFYFQLMYGQ